MIAQDVEIHHRGRIYNQSLLSGITIANIEAWHYLFNANQGLVSLTKLVFSTEINIGRVMLLKALGFEPVGQISAPA